jgi:Flp pilus assembly pilin Flp
MSFKKFLRSEKGATAIEYGLIAAGIALAISVTIFAFGDILQDLFYDGLSTLLD